MTIGISVFHIFTFQIYGISYDSMKFLGRGRDLLDENIHL